MNASIVDEIYAIIDEHAKKIGIQEVPVAFRLAAPPVLVATVYENRSVTPSQNSETTVTPEINKTQRDENYPAKSIPSFELLGGMITVFCVWLFRKKVR